MDGFCGYGHMGGWMWFGWIAGLVLVVVFARAVLGSLQRPVGGERHGGGQSAEDILRRRYAQGEIDRETFQQMWKDLKV